MALEQKLNLKLTQKLVMTPTLQQAIKLLQLSRLELEQALAQEVQANPLLEMTDEAPGDEETIAAEEAAAGEEAGTGEENAAPEDSAAPAAAVDEAEPPEPRTGEAAPAEEPATAEASPTADPFGEVELESLFANYLHDGPSVAPAWEEGEERSLENSPARAESMFDDLCSQLHLLQVPNGLAPLCEFVIGNLDPDGYLRTADDEVAAQLGVPVEQVREAIATVQRLEPAGIAARSLSECFLLQLQRLDRDIAPEMLALATRVVSDGS